MISHVNTCEIFRYLKCLFMFLMILKCPMIWKNTTLEWGMFPLLTGLPNLFFFTACECMCSSCQAVLLWSTMMCDLQNYSDLKLVRTSLCFKILPMSCRCHFVFPLFSFIFEKKCYFMCQISFELFWSLCSNLPEAAFFFASGTWRLHNFAV